jgi:hypothetical protein
MNANTTAQLHEVGQRLWLDNVTRELLMSGTLQRYIGELSITGLTSSATIFDQAITKRYAYDADIREKLQGGWTRRSACRRCSLLALSSSAPGLRASTPRQYMFELLVPATPDQLHQVGENRRRYDLERRPVLMVQAIRELQEAGAEPDLWKIGALDRCEDCLQVAKTARRDGRGDVGCIMLGRGEDESRPHRGRLPLMPTGEYSVSGHVGGRPGMGHWEEQPPVVARLRAARWFGGPGCCLKEDRSHYRINRCGSGRVLDNNPALHTVYAAIYNQDRLCPPRRVEHCPCMPSYTSNGLVVAR